MSVRALFAFHADALVALLQQMSSLHDAKKPFQFDALPHSVVFWSGWFTSLGWCLWTEGGPNLRSHAGAGRTCCVIIATSSYRATRNVRTPPGVERWKSSPTQTFSPGNFEGCNPWRSEALWWKEFFAKASWKRGIQERHELADPVRTRCVFWSTCCLLLSFTNMKHLARISWLLLFFFFDRDGILLEILLFRCFFWRAFCGFFFFVRGILCHSVELHLVSCHFLSVCSVANEFSVPAAVGSIAIQPGTDGTLALTDKTSLASPAHVVSPTACYYTANIWRCACTESYRLYKNITLIVNPCFTKMKRCLYSFLFHSIQLWGLVTRPLTLSFFASPTFQFYLSHLPEFSLDSDSESEDSEDSDVFSGRFGSWAISMGVSLYSGLLWSHREKSTLDDIFAHFVFSLKTLQKQTI